MRLAEWPGASHDRRRRGASPRHLAWRSRAFDETMRLLGGGIPPIAQHIGNLVIGVLFLLIALWLDFG